MIHDPISQLAHEYDATINLPSPASGIGYKLLGWIKPRHANDIPSSSWSVGGETLGRDYADYNAYSPFLGPLGAKAIRVQTGWAKIEKQPGAYEWGWLDALVDDALAQGVHPWLEFNYGNPIYPNGGGIGLGDGLPSSPEALAAWDRWVRAMVTRYADRVTEWEVWNESDGSREDSAAVEHYLQLYVRTAEIVRDLQPDSQLYALAMSHDMVYAETFLTRLKTMGKLHLVDAITIHGYVRNPDDLGNLDALQAILDEVGVDIELRQGETGAASQYQDKLALRGIQWTENLQAKWTLRRMLAHHAQGVPYNVFTLSDLHYRDAEGNVFMNYKGLLKTNEDQSIHHVKAAYFAVQTVFAIFDDRFTLLDTPFSTTSLRKLAVNTWQSSDGSQITGFWFNDAPPDDANGTSLISLTLPEGCFVEPVLVDPMSARVYELPSGAWMQTDNAACFFLLPVYDAPLLIAERSLLDIEHFIEPDA